MRSAGGPAQDRLRRGRDIRAVLADGARRHMGGVVVYVLPTGGPTRAAFVCGRRVGGAVERNQARRILREAWRALRPRVRSGYDVVFVARPWISGAKAKEMADQMSRGLADHGVIET